MDFRKDQEGKIKKKNSEKLQSLNGLANERGEGSLRPSRLRKRKRGV